MPNGSFVSSYNVNPNNTLTPISKSVSASGLAACWDRTNDRYVYTSDTLSGNLGILSVSPNGTLAAVGPASALGATANPTDSTFDTGNRHFYAFFSGLGEIVGFNVAEDGSLHAITVVQAGAPATGHVGLVAY
jgi:6-phosphogluconolactonase (cycloisomerase 2 family)